MPETIELRVHGVGGATPEGLLGEEGAADVVRVGGDGPTTFHARRRDLHVEAYVWGKLTSRALVQPLWLFLLPFTLVNVAGWMHRPIADCRTRSRWPLKASRLLVEFIGLGLTAAYIYWIANTILNHAYYRESVFWLHGPRSKIVAGGVVLLVLLLVVLWIALSKQGGFERYPPPSGIAPASEDSRYGLRAVIRSLTAEEGLQDPSFWYRPKETRTLLILHVAVGAGALFLTTAWAWVRANDPEHNLRLAKFATYTTEVLLWSLLALGLLHLFGWRRSMSTDGFRWLGPMSAASTGVSLATALFYGISLRFDEGNPDRVASLGSAFGAGSIALIATAIGLGIWLWVAKRRETRLARDPTSDRSVAPNPRDREGRELEGATPSMYRAIGLHRAASDVGRNGDLLLFVPVPVFLAAALYQLRAGSLSWLAWADKVGNAVAAVGSVVVLGFLFYRAFRPGERRIVGILWDVLTFWPRRFHPLAVRPYAERAVPEIQHRLWHHVKERRHRVVLSAHSQGTILAYSALVQLPADVKGEVAFVTYGSPLHQLHEMAFPGYFARSDFDRLLGELFSDGGTPDPRWRSFFHRTDYIGKAVFLDGVHDVIIPDPAERPFVSGLPLDRQLSAWPDPPRTAWADLAQHSHYREEHHIRDWVFAVRCRMGETHLPCRPRGDRGGAAE
ncbi:MAG TPA: hypothetical protein VEN82_07060 [Actinomycetota bacterium]|nr:hypothetical protein [Actinomycetota bacterium]